MKASRIIRETRRLAKGYPNAIYKSKGRCSYTSGAVKNGPEGGQGCILGQAIQSLGYKIPHGYALEPIRWVPDIDASSRQMKWLQAVQTAQDVGDEWGMAVEKANAHYPNTK